MILYPPTPRFLANYLGVELKTLTYLAVEGHRKPETLYTRLKIKKGSSGFREVYKVREDLAQVQKLLKKFLEKIPSSGSSWAYVKGRCILDAGMQVAGGEVLVSVDIKNHFHSIRKKMVREALIAKGLSTSVSKLIALLCTTHNGYATILPQGGCASPLLSNVV